MIAALRRLLLPGGRRARHQVLLFHRVLPEPDPMMPSEPDVRWFDRAIADLARYFEVIPLVEAVERAADNALPAASLSITFDDGYADNCVHALPVLERHGVPATFFIATDYLDGGRMWNDTIIETARRLPDGDPVAGLFPAIAQPLNGIDDRRRLAERMIGASKYLPAEAREDRAARFATLQDAPLPDDLMLSSEQLRRMAASDCVEIGAHTCSHPILANCDESQARCEIEQGLDRLQVLTGQRPRLFAYPNGKAGKDYLPGHPGLVQALGLKAAVATDWGVFTQATDPFQIPRFTPWSRSHPRFVLDLLRARYGML